jgi:hypothetical protein
VSFGLVNTSIMIDNKSDPTKDPEFQKVVQHLLSTPPKPHSAMKVGKSRAPKKNLARPATLCGPITFDPTDPASPPRVWCEIMGYFKNRQELAELLAKMSAAHAAPAVHSLTGSPDPQR